KNERYLCCNYKVLQEVDLRTGDVRTLTPSPTPDIWEPTGLFPLPEQERVLVANYHGRDVLEMVRDGDQLQTIQRYTHPGMRSPENVAVTADGTRVAVADYDGDRLWLFERSGKLAWSREIGQAHGVAFGPDYVVVSSLRDRRISRFDLAGNLQ